MEHSGCPSAQQRHRADHGERAPADTQEPAPLAAPEASMDAVLESLRQSLGAQTYNAWFKQGTRLALEGQTLRVLVPNSFVAKWIESHYLPQISAAAAGMPSAS